MTAALLVLRNALALAVLAAGVWAVARAVRRYLEKRSGYYDVESMDDAEILARKYERKTRERGAK